VDGNTLTIIYPPTPKGLNLNNPGCNPVERRTTTYPHIPSNPEGVEPE